MNIITKALSEIYFEIPTQVLNAAFITSTRFNLGIDESIEHKILDKVIYGRVIPDCNLYGGQNVEIDLSQCPSTMTPDGSYIFKIPKDLTNGRSILSALSVYTGIGSGVVSGPGGGLIGAAGQILGSGEQAPFTGNVELIGENVIAVKYSSMPTHAGVLRALVEYHENMQDIPARGWGLFAELSVLATKAYVYVNTRIKANKAELYGGVTLDSLVNIIDDYANANEDYKLLLKEKWFKVSYMLDQTSHNRHLRRMLNPSR